MRRNQRRGIGSSTSSSSTMMILCFGVLAFAFLGRNNSNNHSRFCADNSLTKPRFRKPIQMGTTASSEADHKSQGKEPILSCAYHSPPPTPNGNGNNPDPVDFYKDNHTPFGRILRGQLPAAVYAESAELLCFRDKHARAPLHALVIPKELIPTVKDLTATTDDIATAKNHGGYQNHVQLLQQMRRMAEQVLQEQQPAAWAAGDYRLCFHVPPFNSVDHLHLHVLAPVSQMSWLMTGVKYNLDTIWVMSLEDVEKSLQEEQQEQQPAP